MNDIVNRFAVHYGYINHYHRQSIHIGLNPIAIKERNVSTPGLHFLAIHEVRREKKLDQRNGLKFDVIFLQREAIES